MPTMIAQRLRAAYHSPVPGPCRNNTQRGRARGGYANARGTTQEAPLALHGPAGHGGGSHGSAAAGGGSGCAGRSLAADREPARHSGCARARAAAPAGGAGGGDAPAAGACVRGRHLLRAFRRGARRRGGARPHHHPRLHLPTLHAGRGGGTAGPPAATGGCLPGARHRRAMPGRLRCRALRHDRQTARGPCERGNAAATGAR